MARIAKRAAWTALFALIGYFVLFPGIAVITPAAYWDGNGPRFEENTIGDTFFWLTMASFAVFVVAAAVAVVGGIIARVSRPTTQV